MALKLLVYFIIPLAMSCFVATADYSCNQIDKDSLLAFSSNLNISFPYPPLNWTDSVDCCSWEGILCAEDKDNKDKRVIGVLLPSRGLSGSISAHLSNLTGLLRLNLSHNRLSGTLPTFVANDNSSTSSINEVDLSSNLLYGAIPSSFLQLLGAAAGGGSLTSFNISNNIFTGQIPASFLCRNEMNSSSLKFLDVSSNEFSGRIPSGLGACSQLEIFRAGHNFLTGPLPSDIYDAISLTEISLPINELFGTIGDDIISLTNLKTLKLYSNQLVGQIPQNIGELSKLEHLLLHFNNLTGMLPPSLMDCVNLVTLNLGFNFLEGNLSDLNFSFSGFINLAILDLAHNYFTGNLPTTIFSCKSLVAVRFAANQLEGELTPDILGLQSLSFLSLSHNKLRNFTRAMRIFTGLKNLTILALTESFNGEVMPDDENLIGLDGFQKLRGLNLGGCNFTGSVPSWLAKFKKLEVLDLSFNRLAGSIPAWLATLRQLFALNLSNNFLTGIFPPELARLPALSSQQANDKFDRTYLELTLYFPIKAGQQQYNQLSRVPPAIYLRNNGLSGRIPKEIAQLIAIHQLDLSHNYFSGNIPVQLSHLTNLENLDLSGNNLSGEIPVSLKSLHFLSFFSVAENDLEGEIPTGGQFDTFPPSSFEGNPRLCGAAVNRACSSHEEPEGVAPTPPGSNRALHIGLGFGIGFGIFFNLTVYVLWSRLDGLLKKLVWVCVT